MKKMIKHALIERETPQHAGARNILTGLWESPRFLFVVIVSLFIVDVKILNDNPPDGRAPRSQVVPGYE